MTKRYFFTVLLAVYTLTSFAQEEATKISDFNFGNSGQSIITTVHAGNGVLYGNFNQFYGDDGASLISTIDPQTGAATAILDPNQSAWFGGSFLLDQTMITTVGDMTFGFQTEANTGQNIYRLDGDTPELLLSSTSSLIAAPVLFRDSIYFLVGGPQLRQSPTSIASPIAELYRSDGTAAGTEKVATLLSFASGRFLGLTPGEDKLLITLADGEEQVYYVYDPQGDGLGLLGQGFGQFILDNPPGEFFTQPVGYFNGAWYLTGSTGGFNSESELYRVDEETFAIESIELPVIPSMFNLPREYDQVEFQQFGENLYLFAGRTRGENGTDFYRIGGDEGTTLEPVRVSPEIRFTVLAEYFTPTIQEDTLYYVSRRATDSLTVFSYLDEADAPEEVATLWVPTVQGYLEASGDFIYLILDDEDLILRLNKTDGSTVLVDYETGFLTFSLSRRVNPIAVLPTGAYWVDDNSTDGISFLSATADTVTKIGAYQESLTVPRLYGRDSIDKTLLLLDGNSESGVGSYAENDDIFSTLSVDSLVGSTLYQNFVDVAGVDYYSVRDTNFLVKIVGIVDGTATIIPAVFSGTVDQVTYGVNVLGNIAEDRQLIEFSSPGIASSVLSIATVSNDSLVVSQVPLAEENLTFTTTFTDSALVMRADDPTGAPLAYVVQTFTGQELFRVTAQSGERVRGLNGDGLFVQSINPATFESEFTFLPADGSAPVAMPNAVNLSPLSGIDDRFFVVNGRLLFVADFGDFGREWAVADPTLGTTDILVDINPGTAWSRLFSDAFYQSANGLFFRGTSPETGNELWYTDGSTEGTIMLPEMNPGVNSSTPSQVAQVDSMLFFSANSPSGYEVFRMHIGNRNPELIIDVNPGPGNSHPTDFTNSGSDFYFMARSGEGETFELFQIAYELVPTEAPATNTPAKVFPNPAGNQPITVLAPEGESISRTQVFNTTGQLLQENSTQGERSSLDLSTLPAGTYWVRTWYESGRFSLNAVQRVR